MKSISSRLTSFLFLILLYVTSAVAVYADMYVVDGIYNAHVQTEGKTYQVSVEVEDGEVTYIYWPTSGDMELHGANIVDGIAVGHSSNKHTYRIEIGDLIEQPPMPSETPGTSFSQPNPPSDAGIADCETVTEQDIETIFPGQRPTRDQVAAYTDSMFWYTGKVDYDAVRLFAATGRTIPIQIIHGPNYVLAYDPVTGQHKDLTPLLAQKCSRHKLGK